MPDPFNEMQGEIKKPGLVARLTGAASAAQQAFENPQAFQAFGTQMEETLGTLAKQIAVSVGEEISKFTNDFTSGIEQQMGALTEAIKKMSRETSEEIGRNVESISEKADRYSEQSIQKMLERYNRMEEAAKASKQSLDELLPKIENDPNLKKIFAMMNFQVSDDPTTGRLMFQVGDKKVPLEEITTEQISQVARTGQLTAPPPPPTPTDYRGIAEKYSGGIQQVTGAMLPIAMPTAQIMSAIAPTSLEQMQMGMGMAQGAAGGIQSLGMGLTALGGISPALGAAGAALGPIGAIAGAALTVATPFIEGQMRKNIEREERMWRMGGAGYGREYGRYAGAVYEKHGAEFFPAVGKEEMESVIQSFAALGVAGKDLEEATVASGNALKGLGITAQDLSTTLSYTYQALGTPIPETTAAMAVQQAAAGVAGIRGGEQQQGIYGQAIATGYQTGMAMRGDEDYLKVMGVISAELGAVGMREDEVSQFISFMLTGQYRFIIFDKPPAQMTETQILSNIRKWVIGAVGNRDISQATAPELSVMSQMLGGISPNAVQALSKWARGESREAFEKRITETGKGIESMTEVMETLGGFRERRRHTGMSKEVEAERYVFGQGGGFAGIGNMPEMDEEQIKYALSLSDEEVAAIETSGGGEWEKLDLTLTGLRGEYGGLKEAREHYGVTQRTGGLPPGWAGSETIQDYLNPKLNLGTVTIQLKEGFEADLLKLVTDEELREAYKRGLGGAGSKVEIPIEQ